MEPLVYVVVLGWNSEKDLPECLNSLIVQDYSNVKVLYVDNSSTDQSIQLVQSHFPQVEIIHNRENLYFTGGNNVGIKAALEKGAEFVCILNPDTILPRDWLSKQMTLLLTEPKAGVIGPKILFAEGFGIQPDSVSDKSTKYVNSAGMIAGGFLFPYDRGFGKADHGQFDMNERMYAVTGTSLLVRKEAIEQVGVFDERFQMYLDDVDWCVRIHKAGWDILYTGSTYVLHKHMQSTGKQSKGFYFAKSRRNYLLLVSKHYSFKKLLRAIQQTYSECSSLGLFLSIFWDFLIASTKQA